MKKELLDFNDNDTGALVLTRRLGESFRIGDNERVTIIAVNGMHVKLFIQAPKDVPILREELLIRDQFNKKEIEIENFNK